MQVLQIEHPVPSFEAWKQAFDRDPVDRKGSGVRRYRIMRAADDPNQVLVELELDDLEHAEAMRAKLLGLWTRVEGSIMTSPRIRIFELTEHETC